MGVNIKIDVHIDTAKLTKQFEALKDDKCMYEIHNLFAKMCDPYVPMKEGVLSQSVYVNISKSDITYPGPYAHYMYVGEVYGPNIPIFEDGVLVGFFSKPGEKKQPTGREIQYNKEMHPLASKEWDKAMMSAKGEEFLKAVQQILLERCKELYG